MPYTVKKLAKISGISPRTLRFYDEIGLLKPAYYGDNHYRYYEEEQLLMLQQILFFRELGLPLSEIQRIISSHDFDKLEALNTHKIVLQKSLEKTETLLKTIDKTIAHIKGKIMMRDTEMYDGFDAVKQQEYESYLLNKGTITQQQINESWQRARNWKKSDWETFQQEGDRLNKEFAKVLRNQLKPDAAEVQVLVRQHYLWVTNFWTPTKTSYLGLGKMYLEHPDFREFYNTYHPNLVEFLVEAMQFFANHKLT
ncbi:MerR family transcriptional regulator [Legionella cardiaca]|uniref:MerR family transcriptional regulator n=1 Tax=Legionella cardiaca TaxID=1071983 RepID=A0ABY8AUM6_9GAMM|nr:MerR family transcriptional regulator [Legionella cardiaca]WED44288.1 MerR family transcriptional regulator [Legionella cardiaca]